MERLTEWRDGHGALTHGDGYTKLAQYEDTGLSPEEIQELLKWSYGPLHKKLSEWIWADRDNRLVVLPVKIGGEVDLSKRDDIEADYARVYHIDIWESENCPYRLETWFRLQNGTVSDFDEDDFGKNVFPMLKEA